MEQPTLFTIRCSGCKQQLPDDQFMPSVQRKRAGYCRPCQAAYMRTYKTGRCLICDTPITKANMRCRACANAGRRRVRPVRQPRQELRINRHGRPEGPAWERIRKAVIDEANECAICNRHVDKTLPHTHRMGPTVDHIKPLSMGGHPTERSNLRLAHRACNSRQQAVMASVLVERLHYARMAAQWATLGL